MHGLSSTTADTGLRPVQVNVNIDRHTVSSKEKNTDLEDLCSEQHALPSVGRNLEGRSRDLAGWLSCTPDIGDRAEFEVCSRYESINGLRKS